MRQIVLDTETTGLEASLGHRIIEIGCVELINRRTTGRTFHRYVNPERDVEAAAYAVHGIGRDRLQDKPRFAEIAEQLTQFIAGTELIAHNAAFDVAFLDAEYARLSADTPIKVNALCQVLDTLALAREMHPGQRNSLDALCKRYGIDNSRRELHGALLDARILADVYLAMTGGQSALQLSGAQRRGAAESAAAGGGAAIGKLRVIEPTAAELAAHMKLQELLDQQSGGHCQWWVLEGRPAAAAPVAPATAETGGA
jgi:DNA polymerase-3 subunit epsilon